MNLKIDIPTKIIDKYQLKDHEYSAPFNLYKEKYVNGFLVVDNNYIYTFINDKLRKKYKIADFESVKCKNNFSGGYIYGVYKDKSEEIICCFNKTYLTLLANIALGIDLYIKDSFFVKSNQKETHCPKCHIPYIEGTTTCPNCSENKSGIKKLFKYAYPYRFKLIFQYALLLIPILISLVNPWIYERLIDDFIYAKNYSFVFVILILALVVLYVITLISNIIKGRIEPTISNNMVHDIRVDLYKKVQKLSINSANSKTTGGLINTLNNDTAEIQSFLIYSIPDLIINGLTIILSLTIMFSVEPIFTLLIVSPMPFIYFIRTFISKKIGAKYELNWKYTSNSNDVLHDILNGIKVVKTFSKEEKETNRFKETVKKARDNSVIAEKFWATLMPITWVFTALVDVIAMYYLGSKVLHIIPGDLSFGEMTKWITYCSMLFNCINFLIWFPRDYMYFNVSAAKVFEILDESVDVDLENKNEVKIKGDVTLKNVRFGYLSYTPVLKNINLEVKSGETIGIVGHSGSGKTTLVNLLMKLYDCDHGEILIDGKNIKDLDAFAYRKHLGVVLQETFLFAGSIFDNIRYGNENATYFDVIQAAKKAKIHDAIINKEMGYDTIIGTKGAGLSGGEKQRVAIARAILNEPSLYILDEATASLDTVTEKQIQDELALITKDKTTFIIAHRLSTLKNADRLIVLDKGSIVEVGTHKELIDKKGYYYELVNAQYMTYQKKAEDDLD